MQELNKVENKTSFKYIFIILLLFSILGISFIINYKIDKINIPSNDELTKLTSDTHNKIINLKNQIDNVKILDKSEQIEKQNMDQKDNINDIDNLIKSHHHIVTLISDIQAIKEIIYRGGNYSNYLYDFEKFTRNENIKKILEELNHYVGNNISILELIALLSNVDFSKVVEEYGSTSKIVSYLGNIIKIKKIDSKKNDSDKITLVKNHLINREFKQALDITDQMKSENKDLNLIVDKLSVKIKSIELLDELNKYVISKDFFISISD